MQTDQRAIGVCAQDDVIKLFAFRETAQCGHRELKNLIFRSRGLTNLARCDLNVLLFNRLDHILRSQTTDCQALRIEPDSHAVIPLPQKGDVPHTGQSGKFIPQLNGRVIAEIEVVPTIIGRKQIHDHQHAG